jgi:uncharacterized protein YqeY
MASLKDRISSDLKEAMRSRDQLRLDTLRAVLSGFTYKRTEAGQDLSDADELAVVARQVKQRADAIAEYEKANRPELAEKEAKERAILAVYLPAQKSADEIRAIVVAALKTLPADGRNQGALMKIVMPQLKGLADGNVIREIVTEALREPG